uniref:Pyrrolidone-carboxylate peptidase n=1 Tax=Peronospora matthiolae TaxID=2874970 RepID=A0AAV1T1W9_9STRA
MEDTTTAKAAPSLKQRDVYVTGFGKFGNMLENPTTLLAEKLSGHPKVTETHVLEVSAAGCKQTLADVYARAEERGRPCVFLHFGVSATARTLLLEQVGYNVADFRIPDERGHVAKNEVIHEGEPANMTTKVCLDQVLAILQGVDPRVAISTDPGRFVCNYVYYRSLVWANRQTVKHHLDHIILFVHVPEFRSVCFEDQVALASAIVDILAQTS